MSNQASKILYNSINSLENVQCERVYAVEKDFEAELKKHHISLYSLESNIPLKDFDILAFSIGFELSFTNILQVLDLGGIPLKNDERGSNDPIVIAGGPALTNPLPFSHFLDFMFMGEAEVYLQTWIQDALKIKENAMGRHEMLDVFRNIPSFWYKGKIEITTLVRWDSFGKIPSASSGLPVPSVTVVQDQGVVEIMRGCPNKCRFCHAGVFYRPKREKDWGCPPGILPE
jgi:radical SAM superfamily enzyme YgiQ (UPF0313 family)